MDYGIILCSVTRYSKSSYLLHFQEECSERIGRVLQHRDEIELQLKTIGKKLSNLKPVETEAEHFAEVIKSTAALAEDVSAKVRQLDKAKVTCH